MLKQFFNVENPFYLSNKVIMVGNGSYNFVTKWKQLDIYFFLGHFWNPEREANTCSGCICCQHTSDGISSCLTWSIIENDELKNYISMRFKYNINIWDLTYSTEVSFRSHKFSRARIGVFIYYFWLFILVTIHLLVFSLYLFLPFVWNVEQRRLFKILRKN